RRPPNSLGSSNPLNTPTKVMAAREVAQPCVSTWNRASDTRLGNFSRRHHLGRRIQWVATPKGIGGPSPGSIRRQPMGAMDPILSNARDIYPRRVTHQ